MPIRGRFLYYGVAIWSALKIASLYFLWWLNKRRKSRIQQNIVE